MSPGRLDFAQRYCDVMQHVWSQAANDQRPAVLEWLSGHAAVGMRVADIGAGDAYYVAPLRPTQYVAVEPNPLLQQRAKKAVDRLGAACTVHSSISHLLAASAVEDFELILMIHVLLYLAPDEASALLTRVCAAGKTLLMVHPDPQRSISVAFERTYGVERSSDLLRIKADLLGPPKTQTRVESHFVVPADFSTPDLAFLVSHHVLDGTLNPEILALAEAFVQKHSREWRAGPHLKLPQSQIMEVYGPW